MYYFYYVYVGGVCAHECRYLWKLKVMNALGLDYRQL